ncbi:outer membrane protein assembly factor BamD [Amantichitinum ursilacus]|uniref:Outer membrane protein assembly factor BamD n=1 Tax=Amantichitinum ursilacus TaxID=857265 RepID=A0A0N1JRY2_9NEIS|nr:outer membrane protein assembly factor BamD [Amantichitinum ursilacus]KPC50252.1 Outer membrane protein assembly factor BamD precursor [Amantichitinum ursilacus]
MNKILPRILAFTVAGILLAGCASNPEGEDETKGWSAEKIYSEAKADQNDHNWDASTKLFEKLEARYPYGRYAQQAVLETAFNQYKNSDPALALASIDRFIKTFPAHPSMDYALYLKGLVNFNDSQGFLSVLAKQDMSERDPKSALDSYDAFKELVTRFPDSKYAEDARTRMGYLIGALANHELHVAKYYYKRGAYLAAANRGKSLLETYSNTKQVEPALGIMVRSYDKLQLVQLRDDAKRVLLQNYPNTKVLEDSYWNTERWWSLW